MAKRKVKPDSLDVSAWMRSKRVHLTQSAWVRLAKSHLFLPSEYPTDGFGQPVITELGYDQEKGIRYHALNFDIHRDEYAG